MKKLFLTAFVSVLLAGCAGTNFNWDNARQIKQGMSEKEAVSLMGTPSAVRSSPEGLIYVWTHVNGMTGSIKTVSMVVKDGVVVSAPVVPDGYK